MEVSNDYSKGSVYFEWKRMKTGFNYSVYESVELVTV